MNFIPTTLKVLALTLFGINFAVIIACGVWLILYRGTNQVAVSQPFFLVLVLIGCLISSSTIIAMAQEDDDGHEPENACMAIPWLYSVGFRYELHRISGILVKFALIHSIVFNGFCRTALPLVVCLPRYGESMFSSCKPLTAPRAAVSTGKAWLFHSRKHSSSSGQSSWPTC
jgi:hypothetical protein